MPFDGIVLKVHAGAQWPETFQSNVFGGIVKEYRIECPVPRLPASCSLLIDTCNNCVIRLNSLIRLTKIKIL